MKPITINVPVPQELKTALEQEAETQDLAVSQLVRRILKGHIAAKTTSTRVDVPAAAPIPANAEHPGEKLAS